MHTLAIYYPYIRIPDGEWLRSSLLLWDNIAAIVPEGQQPEENHISQQLRKIGLIKFIDPMDHYKVLDSQGFSEKFIALMNEERIKDYINNDARGLNLFNRGIHRGKLNESIERYFEEHHGAPTEGDWITVNPNVADVYMTYLASKISSIWHSSPMTNIEELDELQGTIASFLENSEGRKAANTITTDIQAELPKIPPDYPIDKLLKWKNKHQRYYNNFRNKIINLRARLAKLTEDDNSHYILDDFKHGMDDSISQLHDMAKNEKWSLVHASIRTTFSVSTAVSGMLLMVDPTPDKVVGLGASGLILSYKYYEELRTYRIDKKRALHENDYSYLYLLGQKYR